MKALSFTQCWATLVALGAKKVETRSWRTGYRGWLAIHAAIRFDADSMALCDEEPFRSALVAGGIRTYRRYGEEHITHGDLPRGAIIAVGNLHRVGRIGRIGRNRRGQITLEGWDLPIVDEREIAFGNFEAGRYAWNISSVRLLPEPIPCRGQLGLWDVPREISAKLEGIVSRS